MANETQAVASMLIPTKPFFSEGRRDQNSDKYMDIRIHLVCSCLLLKQRLPGNYTYFSCVLLLRGAQAPLV